MSGEFGQHLFLLSQSKKWNKIVPHRQEYPSTLHYELTKAEDIGTIPTGTQMFHHHGKQAASNAIDLLS